MTVKRNVPIPDAGQESVWDYPRPPRVEAVKELIRVVFNDLVIAETSHAMRVLETSHPPVYYLPQRDIRMEYLTLTERRTFCEFKGAARYWTIKVGERVEENAGWSYPKPEHGYESITDQIAFYATRVDDCFVGDELVTPQAGDFYGGWITSKIVGPFKGTAGTEGW